MSVFQQHLMHDALYTLSLPQPTTEMMIMMTMMMMVMMMMMMMVMMHCIPCLFPIQPLRSHG